MCLDASIPSLSYSGHLNTLLKSTINISCLVESNDLTNIQYLWYDNENKMANSLSSSSTISIFVGSRDVEGNYSCSVRLLPTGLEKESHRRLSVKVLGIMSFCVPPQIFKVDQPGIPLILP